MATIPISLDDEIIKKIDFLIKKGIYKNRSEALRDQIVKGLEKFKLFSNSDDEDKSKDYHNVLDYLINLKSPPDILKTKKSVTELVSEGRER